MNNTDLAARLRALNDEIANSVVYDKRLFTFKALIPAILEALERGREPDLICPECGEKSCQSGTWHWHGSNTSPVKWSHEHCGGLRHVQAVPQPFAGKEQP